MKTRFRKIGSVSQVQVPLRLDKAISPNKQEKKSRSCRVEFWVEEPWADSAAAIRVQVDQRRVRKGSGTCTCEGKSRRGVMTRHVRDGWSAKCGACHRNQLHGILSVATAEAAMTTKKAHTSWVIFLAASNTCSERHSNEQQKVAKCSQLEAHRE